MNTASQLTDIRKRLSRLEDLIKRQNLILQGKDPDLIITTKSLDAAIKSSYQYAHSHCIYGPSDRHFPPGEGDPPYIDCVGLALRALYLLKVNDHARNINQIVELCEKAGLVKSTNINDVYKRHGIVLMCHKNDRNNIYHVYYSLGGDDLTGISKYDLGSDERIKSAQPFTHAQVNEWVDKFVFKCIYYPE